MRLSPPLPHPPAIAGAAVWLPPDRDTAEAAIAAGRLDEETAARLEYEALARGGPDPAEMAARAGQDALRAAGRRGDEIDLVVHASTYDQGNDFWSPAHYVARAVGAHAALAMCVQQMCNGATAALEVAAARIACDPGVRRALVTTADRFDPPGFDRWQGDYDVGYGDGATAVVLDRDAGALRLLSIASVGDTRHEAMHRGDGNTGRRAGTVDIRARKRAYARGGAMPVFKADLRAAMAKAIRSALDDAAVQASDPRVRCLVLPRIGVRTRAEFYDPAIDAAGVRRLEAIDFGRRTGHLGAGDISANLADLDASGRLSSGDIALLLGVGAGFTWSCVIVERQ